MRTTFWLLAVGLLVFGNAVLIMLTQTNAQVLSTVADWSAVVLGVLCVVSFWLVWKHLPVVFQTERKGWLFTLGGFALFACGDLLWAYFEFFHMSVPMFFPDFFWTAGYVLWSIGIYYFLSVRFFPSKSYLYTVLGSAFVVAGMYAYAPLVDLLKGASLVEVLSRLYIVYDFVLLGLMVLMLLPLLSKHNRLLTAWLAFGLAILTRVAFDFLVLVLVKQGVYWSGHSINLLYGLAYLLCIFAADAKFSLLRLHEFELPKLGEK